MAGPMRQVGQGLPSLQGYEERCRLQGLHDIPQLCTGDTGNDIHHKLYREAQPGLPPCHAHEGGNAKRGVCPHADGQRRDGTQSLRQGSPKNHHRQDAVP